MNEKIKSLQRQKEQLLEKQKKFLAENQKKIKQINEQIASEKKKEEIRYEQMLVSMVKDFYGEINEETIRNFKQLVAKGEPVMETDRRSGETDA